MSDPFDAVAQEESREALRLRAAARAKQDVEDVKWLMSNKRGRRVMYGLLERAGVWRLSFNTNALQMAFNEGNRNWGLSLTATVSEHCPEQYALMLKEHTEND